MRINPVTQNSEKQNKIIDFEAAKTNKEKEVTFTLEELEDTPLQDGDAYEFVFEIDEDEFRKLEQSPFWKVSDMKWRISGPIQRTYKDDGSVNDIGVNESNRAAINLTSLKIKNISLYLPNLLQFYK